MARVDGEVANKTKGEGYVKLRLVPLIQLLNLKAFEQQCYSKFVTLLIKIYFSNHRYIFFQLYEYFLS